MTKTPPTQPIHILVPDFILEKSASGEKSGAFRAGGLFCDISGFSTMTETLMQYGQHGTEVLAGIMRDALEPLIRAVYEQGGFIATQAGDAFTALFPVHGSKLDFQPVLAAAWNIQQRNRLKPVHHTEYGEFAISVKVGLSEGEVSWGIVTSADGNRAAYFFQGSAVDGCAQAEHHAVAGQIILDEVFFGSVQDTIQAEALGGYYLLQQVEVAFPEPVELSLPQPDLDVMAYFFPKDLATQSQRGEFRQTTTLFIHLPTVRTETQLRIFTETLFELQEQYGGLLNRLDFGDKGSHLLLFWGAPVAHENDIERALNFILELQIQTSIPISAGVTHRISHAGFIGSDLREEYTCYGPGINLAARLMSAAPRGEIWTDEVVARRVKDKFELDDAGEMTFKGFANPQKVFVLVERKWHTVVITEGQIIGRKQELEKIAAFVQPVFEGQYPGSFVVWGEAGIGKSRLVYEYQNASIFKEKEALWVVCKTDELLNQSLNPFRYWLQSYFDVSDAQVEARNKRNFNRKLDGLILSLGDEGLGAELDRTRSFLGALLDLYWSDSLYAQLDARGRYENTFTGLITLLKAESQQQPLILLLEDSQWLDGDSQAFLVRLDRSLGYDGCQTFPIAILATSRNTGEPFPVAGEEVRLEGLSWIELAEYAEGLLGRPAAPVLLDLLEQYAEGNPFFIEQILRYLREEKLLLQDEHGRETYQLRHGSILPGDVRLVLVSRLDRLSGKVRQTVQAASVLGREFEIRLLGNMLRENGTLPSWVRQAEEQAIWSALSEWRYVFKHALVREAAYAMQLRSQRTALHALAVEAMEVVYLGDLSPHYGELAYHSEKAGLREKSWYYLKLAGEQAAENFQNNLGLDYFNRALALVPKEACDLRCDLLLARESLFDLMGRREEQAEDLQELEQMMAALKAPEKQAEVAVRRAKYWLSLGEYGKAADAARQGVFLAEKAGQIKIWVDGQYILSDSYYRRGEYETALQAAENGMTQAQAIDYPKGLGRSLNIQGMIILEQGDPGRARGFFEGSLGIFKQSGDLQSQDQPLNNLGLVSGSLKDYKAAQHHFQQSLVIARQIGDRDNEGAILINLGYIAGILGDFVTARSFLELAIRLARETGNPLNELYCLLNLSFYAGLLGNDMPALANADQALSLALQTHDRSSKAWALTYRGHALGRLERLDEAECAYREAMEIREELKQKNLVIEPCAGLARLELKRGNVKGAFASISAFIPQIERGNPLDGTDEPIRVYLTCYQVLDALEDPRAVPILEFTYQLLNERANLINDEGLRDSFLYSIPYHRELIAAWKVRAGHS